MLYLYKVKKEIDIMALDYNVIGARLKKAREDKNLTQQKLAEIIDVSVPFLSRVETGEYKINLK